MKDNNTQLHFYRENEDDQIWWAESDKKGEYLFSFDQKEVFNLFVDYPNNLTPEQKKIFDEENPFWVDFFKDRQ